MQHLELETFRHGGGQKWSEQESEKLIRRASTGLMPLRFRTRWKARSAFHSIRPYGMRASCPRKRWRSFSRISSKQPEDGAQCRLGSFDRPILSQKSRNPEMEIRDVNEQLEWEWKRPGTLPAF